MGEEKRKSRSNCAYRLGSLVLLSVACASASVAAQSRAVNKLPDCNDVVNARILAADGTYLGSFSPAGQPDSILNKNGRFGNPASPASLWNRSGQYGSDTSGKSPMNPHGGRPAQLVKDGKIVGRLMQGSLRSWIEDPTKLIKRCGASLS